eukprot:TRINITY_DN3644_c0_g1_i4.p1 TRINITY_DN3644_c0_g1~~TRINITY_DN3644_c0_g1_i4.p1  ORF type:complete len:918 (-),score=152.77 TRINITY_DN3644_c0_g1_i4:306-3059(-)
MAFTAYPGRSLQATQSLCIGTGRFLRAVLLPALEAINFTTVLVQPRGSNVIEMLDQRRDGSFELEIVQVDGTITIDQVRNVDAAGSAGSPDGRAELLALVPKLSSLSIVGFGVTEAGLKLDSDAITLLAEVLHAVWLASPTKRLSVLNTDNMVSNGDHIGRFLLTSRFTSLQMPAFAQWLQSHVTCHNTMVDRITLQRPDDETVPRTEPLPCKALVIEDLQRVLPPAFASVPGVLVRTRSGEINIDHQLKLRIANGTHTASVYVMALSRLNNTTLYSAQPIVLDFLDELVRDDISAVASDLRVSSRLVSEVYTEWRARLTHPHFGMYTFFVCQNSIIKLGARLLPSMLSAITAGRYPTTRMAYAVAVMLRFLTPRGEQPRQDENVFCGQMDPVTNTAPLPGPFVYTTGLSADLSTGVYEFRDADGTVPRLLQAVTPFCNPATLQTLVASVLNLVPGFNADLPAFADLVCRVSRLYGRMIQGEPALQVLKEVHTSRCVFPLQRHNVANVVREAVQNVRVIDLHTHLFPAAHGQLMLWGIDELLTYHYLVAETFMTARTSLTEEAFFALSKRDQADIVWKQLFVDRSPISEASRGVLTTLSALGLSELVTRRDLAGIRAWFDQQDPDLYMQRVFAVANIDYAVMTNIPFDAEEERHWPKDGSDAHVPPQLRSALRVDPLLKGDWEAVATVLKATGYELDFEGAKQYLRDWVKRIRPEYLMASTPADFQYPPMPSVSDAPCGNELLAKVLVPIAEELNLPLAMKIGAQRAINPALRFGGDGMQTVNTDVLRRLVSDFPRVKFLVTFLSRANQHEVCVLANKFRNLHLYGCWWYCNNPSIIDEITRMRLEMLGTAFTAQHSDARVLDQLIYKWAHSREVIADALADQYVKLAATGWSLSRDEIERDIRRLFGGSYEEFMQK